MKMIVFIFLYFILLKYFLSVLTPFLFAILIFLLLKPSIDFLERMFRFKKTAIGISLLLSVYICLLMLISYFFFIVVSYVNENFHYFIYLYEEIVYPFVVMFESDFSFIYDYFYTVLDHFISTFSYFLSLIPSFLFSLVLISISSFYLIIDYDEMKQLLMTLLSSKHIQSFIEIKNICLKSIYVYVYTQGILMLICFVILLFVFYVLDIKQFFLFALLLSFLDVLPFIGIGIGMIPLALFYYFHQYYLNCLYIMIVYLFINVIRNILEAYLMNKQLKIPSFILLISLMVHIYMFGFIGVFLSILHMNILFGYIRYGKSL